MRRAALLAALALALPACVGTWEQGEFGALSTRATPVAVSVVQRQVEGRSCFVQNLGLAPRAREAVERALAASPRAEALVNVRMTNQGFCVGASGTAVTMTPEPEDAASAAEH
jgi:hypothetical protein